MLLTSKYNKSIIILSKKIKYSYFNINILKYTQRAPVHKSQVFRLKTFYTCIRSPDDHHSRRFSSPEGPVPVIPHSTSGHQ